MGGCSNPTKFPPPKFSRKPARRGATECLGSHLLQASVILGTRGEASPPSIVLCIGLDSIHKRALEHIWGVFWPTTKITWKKKKNTPVRQFSLSKNMTRVGGAHAYFSASNLVLWRVSSGGGGLVAARLRHVRCDSPRENLHHHGSYIMNSAVDV